MRTFYQVRLRSWRKRGNTLHATMNGRVPAAHVGYLTVPARGFSEMWLVTGLDSLDPSSERGHEAGAGAELALE
jgi:hypothetical protein